MSDSGVKKMNLKRIGKYEYTCILLFLLAGLVIASGVLFFSYRSATQTLKKEALASHVKNSYWFLLNRKSNIEKLYQGVPGDENKSSLIKTFTVKTGIPGERPTPLPKLLGKSYWTIVKKEISDNSETAPYFLTLDVPISDEWPFGPVPYLECNGQCNWVTPGFFGLHGTGGHPEKLSIEDPGSSGCIRHKDEDITYLYNLLEPEKGEIRYYIRDI